MKKVPPKPFSLHDEFAIQSGIFAALDLVEFRIQSLVASIPAIIAEFNKTSTTIIVEVEEVIRNYNRDSTVGRLNQTVEVYVRRAGSLEKNPGEGKLEEARAAVQKYLMETLDAKEGELVVELAGKCLEKKRGGSSKEVVCSD